MTPQEMDEELQRVRQKLVEAQDRVQVLEKWKRETMEVEAQWSPQAVGQELDVPLGTHIRLAILPGINSLKSTIKELESQVETLKAESSDLRTQLLTYTEGSIY